MIPLFDHLGCYDRTFTKDSLQLQPLLSSTDLRNALQAAGFDNTVLRQFQARQWDFRSILPELHDGSFGHHFDWHDQPDHPYRHYLIGLTNALGAIYQKLGLLNTAEFVAFKDGLRNDGFVYERQQAVQPATSVPDISTEQPLLEKTINQSRHDEKATVIHHFESAQREPDNSKSTAAKENPQDDGCVSNLEQQVEANTSIVDLAAEQSLLEKAINQSRHDDKARLLHYFETARREFDNGKWGTSMGEWRKFFEEVLRGVWRFTRLNNKKATGRLEKPPMATTLNWLVEFKFFTNDEWNAYNFACGFLAAGDHPGIGDGDLAHLSMTLATTCGYACLKKLEHWNGDQF